VNFLAGLKGVAAVRKESRPVVFDEQDAGATGKAAEIEDIGGQGNEKRVRLNGFQRFAEPLGAIGKRKGGGFAVPFPGLAAACSYVGCGEALAAIRV